ncbi:MAG: energy transducer TonB [Geobacter sp.]|nr:MAG: energy transducer TonB [Geobacter sp.]
MNTEAKSFLFSFALHLTVLAAAVSFTGMPAPQKAPILIDFTVESVQGTKKENIKNDPGGAPPSRPAAPARHPIVAKPLPVLANPDSFPERDTEPTPLEASPEAAPLAQTTAVAQLPPVSAATAGSSSFTSRRQGNGSGTGTGSGHGSGADQSGGEENGESAETLRMRYLRKHFAYIRDQVAGNLRYPVLARRMGWSGRLSVEFVVQRDGTANNVRIVRSSGVPFLDSDARNTVIQSAPFPKPPVSARLVIPVEYVLEN